MLPDIYKFNTFLLSFGYQISRALPVGIGEENKSVRSVGYETKCVTVFVNIVIQLKIQCRISAKNYLVAQDSV